MSEITDSNKDQTDTSTSEATPEATQFDWDAYMKEFGFEAAPNDCFFQTPEPPKNKFEIGRKLIVPDHRVGYVDCLGSIQQSHAAWVQVRLEGSRDPYSYYRWVMCDDQAIKPISDDHSIINQPFGFVHGPRGYHKWLEQQLSEVDGANKKADVEWFCPINETYRPAKNLFKVGQKLECVDTVNFSETPHVATITKVDKHTVTVHFDGWKSLYDIVEPFDSRNLFPVGWSKKAGLEVGYPSLKQVKAYAVNLAKKKAHSDTPTSNSHSDTPTSNSHSDTPTSNSHSDTPTSNSHSDTPTSNSSNKTPAQASPATVEGTLDHPPKKKPTVATPTASSTRKTDGKQIKSRSRSRAVVFSPDSHVSPPSTSGAGGARKRENEGTLDHPPKKKPTVATPTASSTRKTDGKQIKSRSRAVVFSPDSHVSPPSTSGAGGARKRENEGTLDHPPKKKPTVATPTASSTRKTDGKPEIKKVRPPPAPKGHSSMVKASAPNGITGKAATAPFTSQAVQLTTPSTPTDVMLSCGDSVPQSQRSMTVFFNRNCRCGPLLNPAKIAELPRVIGPLSIHHVVREVIQQLINCGNEHQSVYRKVDAGPVKILSVTAQENGLTNVRYIPIVKNVSAAWVYVRKLMVKIGCCPNLIADCASPCNICPGSPDAAEDGGVSTTQASGNRKSHSQMGGMSDRSAETTGNSSRQAVAQQWGIDRVAQELSKMFEPEIVDKFRQHQIDGRALLLLSTDLLMKHLGMPLGPAIKVVDLVNTLKNNNKRHCMVLSNLDT